MEQLVKFIHFLMTTVYKQLKSVKCLCDRLELRGVKTIPGWCKLADLCFYKRTKVVWSFKFKLTILLQQGNGSLLNWNCELICNVHCLSPNWSLKREVFSIIYNRKAAIYWGGSNFFFSSGNIAKFVVKKPGIECQNCSLQLAKRENKIHRFEN